MMHHENPLPTQVETDSLPDAALSLNQLVDLHFATDIGLYLPYFFLDQPGFQGRLPLLKRSASYNDSNSDLSDFVDKCLGTIPSTSLPRAGSYFKNGPPMNVVEYIEVELPRLYQIVTTELAALPDFIDSLHAQISRDDPYLAAVDAFKRHLSSAQLKRDETRVTPIQAMLLGKAKFEQRYGLSSESAALDPDYARELDRMISNAQEFETLPAPAHDTDFRSELDRIKRNAAELYALGIKYSLLETYGLGHGLWVLDDGVQLVSRERLQAMEIKATIDYLDGHRPRVSFYERGVKIDVFYSTQSLDTKTEEVEVTSHGFFVTNPASFQLLHKRNTLSATQDSLVEFERLDQIYLTIKRVQYLFNDLDTVITPADLSRVLADFKSTNSLIFNHVIDQALLRQDFVAFFHQLNQRGLFFILQYWMLHKKGIAFYREREVDAQLAGLPTPTEVQQIGLFEESEGVHSSSTLSTQPNTPTSSAAKINASQTKFTSLSLPTEVCMVSEAENKADKQKVLFQLEGQPQHIEAMQRAALFSVRDHVAFRAVTPNSSRETAVTIRSIPLHSDEHLLSIPTTGNQSVTQLRVSAQDVTGQTRLLSSTEYNLEADGRHLRVRLLNQARSSTAYSLEVGLTAPEVMEINSPKVLVSKIGLRLLIRKLKQQDIHNIAETLESNFSQIRTLADFTEFANTFFRYQYKEVKIKRRKNFLADLHKLRTSDGRYEGQCQVFASFLRECFKIILRFDVNKKVDTETAILISGDTHASSMTAMDSDLHEQAVVTWQGQGYVYDFNFSSQEEPEMMLSQIVTPPPSLTAFLATQPSLSVNEKPSQTSEQEGGTVTEAVNRKLKKKWWQIIETYAARRLLDRRLGGPLARLNTIISGGKDGILDPQTATQVNEIEAELEFFLQLQSLGTQKKIHPEKRQSLLLSIQTLRSLRPHYNTDAAIVLLKQVPMYSNERLLVEVLTFISQVKIEIALLKKS